MNTFICLCLFLFFFLICQHALNQSLRQSKNNIMSCDNTRFDRKQKTFTIECSEAEWTCVVTMAHICLSLLVVVGWIITFSSSPEDDQTTVAVLLTVCFALSFVLAVTIGAIHGRLTLVPKKPVATSSSSSSLQATTTIANGSQASQDTTIDIAKDTLHLMLLPKNKTTKKPRNCCQRHIPRLMINCEFFEFDVGVFCFESVEWYQ
jgi:hypothetical protein